MKSSGDKDIKKRKVKRVMDEWKAGTLRSSSGQKVTDQKMAVAIGLSEARRAVGRKTALTP